MRSTGEGEVLRAVVATLAERSSVMELEPLTGGAAPSVDVHVRATALVSLMHGPSHRRRDVARGGRRIRLGETFPGALRPGKALGLESLNLLGHRQLDERSQVSVRHRGAHQGLESLQLGVELGAGRELDPVPLRGQWLDPLPTRVRGHRDDAHWVRTQWESRGCLHLVKMPSICGPDREMWRGGRRIMSCLCLEIYRTFEQ